MTTARPTIDLRSLRIELLRDRRLLDNFDSGEPEVDRNIEKCCDWHDQYRNRTFCAFLPDIDAAVGFYCIGISANESKYLTHETFRFWRQQAYIPFIYLNYLAVQKQFQQCGIGTILLMNALGKAEYAVQNIGIYGVALHALNDRSASLYDRYGFREYGGRSKYPFMILPAQSVLDLFAESD